MRQTSAREIAAVLRLDGPARYRHFVKRVVDAEAAWGLWSDGWALMEDDDGREVLPLWPAREYAELARAGKWADCTPEAIGLEDLLGELLPKLSAKNVLPGVFPTPQEKGLTPSVEELSAALTKERENYGE